jgi:hypothetical protein
MVAETTTGSAVIIAAAAGCIAFASVITTVRNLVTGVIHSHLLLYWITVSLSERECATPADVVTVMVPVTCPVH